MSNLPQPKALPNTPATSQSQQQSTSNHIPTFETSQLNIKDEHSSYYAPTQRSAALSPNPPAYNNSFSPPPPPQGPPILSHASALYPYTPADAGDLALAHGDRIAVLEYMNADWAKGRNERTGLEGIFPRAYVATEDRPPMPQNNGPSSYGNLPLAVSQGDQNGVQQQGQPAQSNKVNETGKKFGKKLGNAGMSLSAYELEGKSEYLADSCLRNSDIRSRSDNWQQHCEWHFLASRSFVRCIGTRQQETIGRFHMLSLQITCWALIAGLSLRYCPCA